MYMYCSYFLRFSQCVFSTSIISVISIVDRRLDGKGMGIYFTAGLVTFTSGMTVYLLLSDAARRSEVRRRKLVLSSLE
jgi:hypothetical protein